MNNLWVAKKIRFRLLAVFIFVFASFTPGVASSFDHDHTQWTQLLSKIVFQKDFSSVIDYQQVIQNPEPLNGYLTVLSAVEKSSYDRWSDSQKIAFLINAYNAFTIKLIVDHYPLRSIKNIGSLFSGPWDQEFFPLLGKKVGEIDLEYIEHDLLRKDFKEPRIHFAINCASIGCPNLRNEAYRASNLPEQLDNAAKLFLTDKSRNRFEEKTKKIYLSPIFRWHSSDFEEKSGSIKNFVAPYLSVDPKVQALIKSDDSDIEWTHYDWDLNDSTPKKARMKFKKKSKTK